jgi:hypothetical protein
MSKLDYRKESPENAIGVSPGVYEGFSARFLNDVNVVSLYVST